MQQKKKYLFDKVQRKIEFMRKTKEEIRKELESQYDKVDGVEYDIGKRWNDGIDHHPRSIALFERLMEIDFNLCDDYFCWNKGGDGDNGETLMYELDILFDEDDAEEK